MNNKIDLEIRILDGILKLLNAICVSYPSMPANLLSNSSSSFCKPGSDKNTSTQSTPSNSSIDLLKFNDKSRCFNDGAAIAASMISNKDYSDSLIQCNGSNSSCSNNSSLFCNSPTLCAHTFQILTVCKCLFVSHRKIAIYLNNLNETRENRNKRNDRISFIHSKNIINLKSIDLETCKLMLGNLRIPLTWKWSDHLKASKNYGITF